MPFVENVLGTQVFSCSSFIYWPNLFEVVYRAAVVHIQWKVVSCAEKLIPTNVTGKSQCSWEIVFKSTAWREKKSIAWDQILTPTFIHWVSRVSQLAFTNQSGSKTNQPYSLLLTSLWSAGGGSGLAWAHSCVWGQLQVGEVALLILAGLCHMPGLQLEQLDSALPDLSFFIRPTGPCARGNVGVPEEWAEPCLASWGLRLELAHCRFPTFFWFMLTPKASGWENRFHSWWKEPQSPLAKWLQRDKHGEGWRVAVIFAIYHIGQPLNLITA